MLATRRTAQPVVERERLIAAQRLRAVQDHRGALRRVPELVEIGRDRGDTVHAEVPEWHGMAEPLEEGQYEAAHARVGVEVRAALGGQRGEVGNRVDHTLRVLRCRVDDEHRIRRDLGRHRVDVGAPVRANRHRPNLAAERVPRLVERGVRAVGDDHLGLRDTPFDTAPFACREDCHEDALGAARRHEARGRGIAMEQIRGDAHDVGLERGEARERDRVQRVVVQIELRRGRADRFDLGTSVVHEAEGAPVAPAGVTGLAGAELGEHLVVRSTVRGERHGAGSYAVSWSAPPSRVLERRARCTSLGEG
jgi:hypothetical protein